MGILFHSNLEGSNAIGGPKISYGSEALTGEFPQQVQLTLKGHHHCGGSIISPILILTAAHCLINRSQSSIRVLAGKHNSAVFDDTQQSRRVGRIILHEEYDASTLENDIAIIEMETELEFNDYTKSILVPKDRQFLNTRAETSGWGKVPELDQRVATTLRKVTVQVHNKSYCDQKWGTDFKKGMMCAGIGNKDACKGDSGGPVTCHHLRFPGKKFVCGITSFGELCDGSYSRPGVYTDVAQFYDWIQIKKSEIWRRASCPKDYFTCSNLNCIPKSSTCDRFDDCGDDSDEKYCALAAYISLFSPANKTVLESRFVQLYREMEIEIEKVRERTERMKAD